MARRPWGGRVPGPGSFALFRIDLDRFGQIKDVFGREAGDQVLRHAAARLRTAAQDGAPLYRRGGDDFPMVLPCPRGRDALASLASRMIDRLSAPFHFEASDCTVYASIGIGYVEADRALYQVMATGRGRAQFLADPVN